MAIGLSVENVVTGIAEAFRREFEHDLRQRLLAVAEAEIEFIVKETADRVCVSVTAYHDRLNMGFNINQKVSIHDARTPKEPVHR